MKAIAPFLIFIFIAVIAGGQERHAEDEFVRNFYLERSARQNKTGLILLGAGTALFVGGVVGFDSSWDNGSASQTDFFGFMLLAGAVADLTSIPIFISAGINKRRARAISVSLSIVNRQCLDCCSVYNSSFACRPELTLKIKL